MSGLTGYLTKDGLDLSSVFVSSNTATFASAITTHAGIIAPPTNLTYTSNMIGYTVKIPGTKTNGGITSGAAVSLSGTTPFTIQTGIYILYLYIESVATSADGFWIPILQSIVLPASVNKFIIGNTLQPLTVTSSKTYYFIQQITATSVTSLTNSPNGNGQSYLSIIRIA